MKPFLDNVPRGLFSARYPRRPNPVGVTVVRLLKRSGGMLYVKGADIIDGSPLLDIKPYVTDVVPKGPVRIGWLDGKLPA